MSTQGVLHVRQFVVLQDMISYMRRIAEQAEKGARYLTGLTQFAELTEGDELENETSWKIISESLFPIIDTTWSASQFIKKSNLNISTKPSQ